MKRAEVIAEVLPELRAMRPSTDVNRLSLSRQHREDELAKLAYRSAINDVCERLAALAAREGEATPLGDHPHVDPGDGRTECYLCGKFVHDVIHSCKGVPVTRSAEWRVRALIDAVRNDAGDQP